MADEDIALKVEPTDSLEDDFFTKLKDKEYHELAETIFSRFVLIWLALRTSALILISK